MWAAVQFPQAVMCVRACGCACVRIRLCIRVYMYATVLYSVVAACLRCTVVDNILGFIEDTCDCSRYYRCMRYESGWRALHMSCGQCLMWSQSDLTCSIRIPGCVVSTTSTTTSGRSDFTCMELCKLDFFKDVFCF